MCTEGLGDIVKEWGKKNSHEGRCWLYKTPGWGAGWGGGGRSPEWGKRIVWCPPGASGGNRLGTGSSWKLSLSSNCHAPVTRQVVSALTHHLAPVPLERSSSEKVPTTPPSATSVLEDSSTPGPARMPAFPAVRRPRSQRRARTHASAWSLAGCSRYALWW